MDMDTSQSSVVHLSCHCLNVNIRVVRPVQASQSHCGTVHLRDLAGEKFNQASVDFGNDWSKTKLRARTQLDYTSDGDAFTRYCSCYFLLYVQYILRKRFIYNCQLLYVQ